eukprot:12049144-Ditylum_brightwellii.AAC.1
MEEAEEVYGQQHKGVEDLVMMEPFQTHTYQNDKFILYYDLGASIPEMDPIKDPSDDSDDDSKADDCGE